MTAGQTYLAPFDAVAAGYDETFTSSEIGQAQRRSVWKELATTFRPGERTLEIGCGTGIDACFLANRGVQVLACDSSPEMLAVATRRIQKSGFQKLVLPRLLPAEDICSLPPHEMFDGAFSNFGALNCVEDIGSLAKALSRCLKPGATALLCWMGPYCLWEMIWYLAQGNHEKAFRRLHRNRVVAKLADGAFVRVHYPSVTMLAQSFAPDFRLKSVKGIGVAVPPSYLESWALRHPHLFQFCERTDSIVGRCPGVRELADHVLVRLQRMGAASGMGKR